MSSDEKHLFPVPNVVLSHHLSISIDRFVVVFISCIIALEINNFPNLCHLKLIVIVIAVRTEIEEVEGGALRGSLSHWKNVFSILGWSSLH